MSLNTLTELHICRTILTTFRTAVLLILLMILFLPCGCRAEIVIPANVRVIQAQAFAGIHTDRVVLPQGLTSIDQEAFAGSMIGSISLPDSITFIAPDAFRGAQITSLELPAILAQGSALQQWATQNAASYSCLPPVDLSTVPTSIPAGFDFMFSFQMVDGADWYEIKGTNAEGRDILLFVEENWEDRLCSTHVPGYNIQPGNLHLEVTAFQYVYDASINYQITRTTSVDLSAYGSIPSAPEISVTGIISNIASPGQPYTITVSWEGNISEISDYHSEFTGYGGSEQESTYAVAFGQSSYQSIVNYSQDHVGINTYRYAIKADGVWSPVSETVVYVMDRNYEDEYPECITDSPSVSMPAEISAGKDLTFRFSSVNGAVDYRILIEYGNDQGITPDSEDIDYEGNSRTFTLEGYQLEPGPLRVIVTAKGMDGRELSSSGNCMVTGSKPSAPAITASSQNPQVSIPYTVTVDTRGADSLVMLFGSENWEYYEQIPIQGADTVIPGFTDNKPDQYYYGASVRINGLWSAWGETVVVTGP